mmetsp:Transcript_18053/g.50531  ORF Transcript_18053/g.50531 Transcript_18053/m.50531 type:complete len:299 (-) Transcript_18053:208-1104(-)
MPTPSKLAKKPTPNSFRPLRAMAPNLCPKEKGSVPGRTFWKALSGQLAKKSRILLLLTFLGAYDKVGAGNHVSMKSAMMAMMTLAATKSISALKFSWRFAFSAVSFVHTPMPHSMATFTGKEGSPSKRSRKPWMPHTSLMKKLDSSSRKRFKISGVTLPASKAPAKSGGKDSAVLPAAASMAAILGSMGCPPDGWPLPSPPPPPPPPPPPALSLMPLLPPPPAVLTPAEEEDAVLQGTSFLASVLELLFNPTIAGVAFRWAAAPAPVEPCSGLAKHAMFTLCSLGAGLCNEQAAGCVD